MDYLLKMMIFHGYVSHNQMAMGFICALVMTGISICGMTRLHPMNPMARTSETRAVLKPAPGVKKTHAPGGDCGECLSWNILESTMDLAMMGTPHCGRR